MFWDWPGYKCIYILLEIEYINSGLNFSGTVKMHKVAIISNRMHVGIKCADLMYYRFLFEDCIVYN
jgi:hypothetical protein